jgi:hypothetical protein
VQLLLRKWAETPDPGAGQANKRTIGVGWSTYFSRPGIFSRFTYYSLKFTYRSPAFFADAMLRGGNQSNFVRFDDDLRVEELDGTTDALAERVDIVYLCSHGEYRKGNYQVDLHARDWMPFKSGLGHQGPRIVVFDTCHLVDLGSTWPPPWTQGQVGPALRFVLGFASEATVCSGSPSQRGRVFALNLLKGDPIADAWLDAVVTTRFSNITEVPIAIAFGDDDLDAQAVLNQATWDTLPGPRTGTKPVVVKKFVL